MYEFPKVNEWEQPNGYCVPFGAHPVADTRKSLRERLGIKEIDNALSKRTRSEERGQGNQVRE